ncbi:SDR family NAD(P)-dependent oxidoreductase [Nocardioides caldifontis]|uniref:SDR family NAD(P)-dependent oxidoreductase n=1 Tax=Nocardioides caldifontis TaxID=2588938 RepID=UPI0011DF3BB5|nr:SDR family NAD(P)-dependent oxidoreductase [Nocardioides caldifontis]
MSRRVLVTGGASGLGAALVTAFVARGDRVLVTDVREDASVPDGASYLRLDVTSEADWEAARAHVEEQWGGLDVLVNNAGIASGGRIDVATLEEWRRVIDINLLGVVRGCRTFTPVMKRQRSGHLVNTASLAGLVHPPGMASYNAVKAGVVALSETLQFELAPYGITTSVVCPSFFRTNLGASLSGSDTVLQSIARRLIDRSGTTAEQIAAEVVRGVDAGRPVILTDRPGRRAVLAKRFARPVYEREQHGFARRIKEAAEGAADRSTTKDGA